VAKHTSKESCWVILYDQVYDVTDFLSEHPGGSRIILQLAGRDATEEYDPIHPPGTLEENLKPDKKLGKVDPDSLAKVQQRAEAAKAAQADASAAKSSQQNGASAGQVKGQNGKPPIPPLQTLLNLDEIEAVATAQLSAKAYSYYFSASDDLTTKSRNTSALRSILLRPRIFIDCTTCSTTTKLLKSSINVGTPLFVAPAAMARLAHPDGEAGIARAAGSFGAMQLLSNNASMTPEQVAAAASPDQVLGWQLYVQNDRRKSEAMLARIAKLKQFKCVVLTLDAPVPGKRELDEKQQFASLGAGDQGFTVQAASNEKGASETRPGGGGIGQQLFYGTATDLTWHSTLPWLAKHTKLPIVLKGLQTHEDAYLAARYAREYPGTVKAIILSNHGGRALDTAPPPAHTLLEIRKYCPDVFDAVDVWIDGGIKRGTDVVKALCLGAKAVGIGRGPLYGLACGGEAGVRRVFQSTWYQDLAYAPCATTG
jgi:isopentenyl diphosphate isomerase/L-lactate dehydrogenase-like FMN-dependent dehydrogenase